MDEMMKKWQEAATPGANHKILDPLAGSWQVDSKMWFEGSDKPPMETKGSSEVKWVLDGRFIWEESQGEMMGQPFAGIGYYGYDNFGKRYQFVWMDNTSTSLFIGSGQYNDKDKAITFNGKMDDPGTGERDKTITMVMRIISPDKHIFEMYDSPKADPAKKTGEIVYTRK